MHRRTVALMVALLSPLPAVDARADLLLAVDGVELHGTVQRWRSGATTCNVRESDTAYESRKANHGAPIDVWRVDAEVRNRTGRWLDRVVATYMTHSEWPACSGWGRPEGLPLTEMYHFSNDITSISDRGYPDVAPGAVLRAETEYFIVLRGDPAPRFDNMTLSFNFVAGGDSDSDPPRRRRPGDVFRDCGECPEMVVLPGGGLALGRYEVTVGEYRAFVSATGGTGNDGWRAPGFAQTDRHPVTIVSRGDARAYVSWLSRRTGGSYRLPTEAEWARAAAGSRPGCDRLGRGALRNGTCPVGSYGSNAAGLSDMIGNVWEWMSDCWYGDCDRPVVRGGSWNDDDPEFLRPGGMSWGLSRRGARGPIFGFRVSRTLD